MTVSKTASAGVDITDTMGFTSTSKSTITAADTPINKVMVFPTVSAACLDCFAPTALPMVTVAPIASPTIMTVSMCMT